MCNDQASRSIHLAFVYCWSLPLLGTSCPPHSPSVSSLNQFLFTTPLSAPSIPRSRVSRSRPMRVVESFPSARVVHPFSFSFSNFALFHFFTDARGEQLLKYLLICVSFLSLLYLFSSVSLALLQSKATRFSAASCQKRRRDSNLRQQSLI